MGKQGEKLLGNFIFDNHWELMNKAATFPGDVWKLAEDTRHVREHENDPQIPERRLVKRTPPGAAETFARSSRTPSRPLTTDARHAWPRLERSSTPTSSARS